MSQPYPYPPAPQSAPVPPAPKPSRFGGLAWTALILGIVGTVFSLIPFLNILSALAAVVGIILGIIAIFGSKKVVALIGTALCVVAIIATVAVNDTTAEELDKVVGNSANQGSVSEGTNTPARPVDAPAAEAPTWGKRYTWKDGLAVEVSAPVACTPSRWASPQNIERAVKFTVTVINGGKEPFSTTLLALGNDTQFNGAKAERVFDSSGECGGDLAASTVMPGKSFTYEISYAVGPQPGEMQLVLSPGFAGDKAVFTGQA